MKEDEEEILKKLGFTEAKKSKEEILQKWKDTGLLERLTGDVKPNIATMLECCKQSKINDDK